MDSDPFRPPPPRRRATLRTTLQRNNGAAVSFFAGCSRGRAGLVAPDQANDQHNDTKQHSKKRRHGHADCSPVHGFSRILSETTWGSLTEPASASTGIGREPHQDAEDKRGNEGADQRQRGLEPCHPPRGLPRDRAPYGDGRQKNQQPVTDEQGDDGAHDVQTSVRISRSIRFFH